MRRTPWRKAAAAAALLVAVLAGGQAPSGAAEEEATTAAQASAKLVPATGALFGSYVKPEGGWSDTDYKNSVTSREQYLGRKYDLLQAYYPFDKAFPAGREAWNKANGRESMVSWSGAPSTTVNSGALDATINARADAVRAFGRPIFVRYFWEMDGRFNDTKTGTPEQFVASWRRIHDLFVRRGATNAVWVWCPTAAGFFTGEAQKHYPGDAYVDWICADGYNWAGSTWVTGAQARSTKEVFAGLHRWGTTRRKPLMVGETGALEQGPGVKAAWIDATRSTLKTAYPAIRAYVYFDSHSGDDDWRPKSSTSSNAAYRNMAQDPYFRH